MTWTHTSRGRALDLLDPKPGDVDLGEIGQSLAQQCRYNGCVRRFYSVAEHSVLISRWLFATFPEVPQLRIAGLLHDAAEAYTGDITYPMQVVLWASAPEAREAYKQVQARLDALICGPLDFSPEWLHCPEVRNADLRILLDEREALLLGRPKPWDVEDMGPLGVTIEGWSPSYAFLTWCRELTEAVRAWSGRDLPLVPAKRCGQPGCPNDAEPGLSLCEHCWDLANDSEPTP